MKHVSIAIDGPSGAGKSSLAKAAAAELHCLYVDTGALYRTIGYYVWSRQIDVADEAAVTAVLPDLAISIRYGDDGLQHMILNGRDVTGEIRLPEVSLAASSVSAYPEVRAYLLGMQQELALKHSVVMDGRDIGTVILPHADVKIFLTASPEARASRRCLELQKRGTPEAYDQVLSEIEQRDYHDTHRAASPLRQAEDAVLLDTTALDFDQSRQALVKLIKEKIGR